MSSFPMRSTFRVLFLGTRNSERSILAEYLLRSLGGDRFEVWSAGETPAGEIHPLALKVLRENFKIDTTGAVSNSWQEFAGRDFDFVITLSDDARERSPVFSRASVTAHWSIDDPAAFEGSEEEKYEHFLQTAFQIKRRIELFNCLPMEKLDHLQREAHTRQVHTDAQQPTPAPQE
jgi:arsenate reductase (thioredoxin)